MPRIIVVTGRPPSAEPAGNAPGAEPASGAAARPGVGNQPQAFVHALMIETSARLA